MASSVCSLNAQGPAAQREKSITTIEYKGIKYDVSAYLLGRNSEKTSILNFNGSVATKVQALSLAFLEQYEKMSNVQNSNLRTITITKSGFSSTDKERTLSHESAKTPWLWTKMNDIFLGHESIEFDSDDALLEQESHPLLPASTSEMPKKDRPLSTVTALGLTSASAGTRDLDSDFCTIAKAGMGTPNIGAPGAVIQAMGLVTAGSAITGLRTAINASCRYGNAEKIGDEGGKVESGLDTIRGAYQSIGGVVFAGYRVTQCTANCLRVNTTMQATTALGRAANILGLMGNSAFGVFYFMITLRSAYLFGQDVKFRMKMRELQGKTDVEQVRFLQEMINDPVKRAEFARATNDECLLAVTLLLEDLRSNDRNVADTALARLDELKGKITNANTKTMGIHFLLLIIGVLGLGVTLLGILGTLGILAAPPMWILATTLLLAFLWIIIDGYFMHTGLNSGKPGDNDEIYLKIFGGITAVSVIVSVALTIAMVGFNPMILLLPIIYGIANLILYSYSYWKLGEKERKWEVMEMDKERKWEALEMEKCYRKYLRVIETQNKPLEDSPEAVLESA